ncbi:hypothetical protein JN403_11395 [Pseudomonas sp. 15A4]|uniref:GTPase-associated system all-helical protein GASH n=1 Tax=Pseudomonas sp. 15A4 TaxID=2804761 RepID=UPI0019689505|nr:GTPase-associated system all-helical protein GASH [Pseudomonas sp. 15A4]QSB21381.1 hypothetical protein JN403_11395 [Pseudomonas sp. 15A4]
MANMLQELLAAGLIDKLEGSDERFKKMTQAADELAKSFRNNPALLIPAILTALDRDISTNDPLIEMAETALLAEWETLQSVHTDKPIQIYRALLLTACAAAAQERNAAILWLTATDMLQFSQLGREKSAVFKLISSFGDETEQQDISLFAPSAKSARKATDLPKLNLKEIIIAEVDREVLFGEIGAATGPHNLQGTQYIAGKTHNRYWPGQNHHWGEDFANVMKDVLGERLDELGEACAAELNGIGEGLVTAFKAQSQGLQTAISLAQSGSTREQVRLDALWWYESMYSASAKMSYREMDPLAAAILMPLDLISIMPSVTPSSVAYLLSEAVARLPNAGFENVLALKDVLARVALLRKVIPDSRMEGFNPPTRAGRLSLRDIVRLALEDPSTPTRNLLDRARVPEDATISLPVLARALLRQEQAIRLAEVTK